MYKNGHYKQITPGYGIVTDEAGTDYFIFKTDRANAFSGDFVKIKIIKEAIDGKKPEAEIIKIISRTREDLVGFFIKTKNKNFGFVRVYNTFSGKDIFIKEEFIGQAKNNDVVIVRIIGSDINKPAGKIVKILGNKNKYGIDETIVFYENQIRQDFPKEVLNEADKLRNFTDFKNRLDLTNELIVTIDGADAKDLDDAISVKILPNKNYELGVHIADVSHYVVDGSFLDKEALNRGTSIYTPGRVIPMLPEKLSNDLCSLNPEKAKATLSIFMEIDYKTSKVVSRKIANSFIKSKARLTYDQAWSLITNYEGLITNSLSNVSNFSPVISNDSEKSNYGKIPFENKEDLIGLDLPAARQVSVTSSKGQDISYSDSALAVEESTISSLNFKRVESEDSSPASGIRMTNEPEIIQMLYLAYELKKLVYARRKKEGKIEFEFEEIKIDTDNDGKVKKIYKLERNEAHKIIEEFMILANEEISRFFSEKKIPFLYRVHEKPEETSIAELKYTLNSRGIFFDEKNINPLLISQIIDSLKGKDEQYFLSKKVLQAMAKAKYMDEALGHFGLSLKYYSHFTSPIRRYPDLQIHRIIKEFLNKELSRNKLDKYKKNLKKVARLSSENEQKAEMIEDEIKKIKTIEFMEDKIGQIFDGIISGITPNGIYVELESGVEGLILQRNFNSNLIYDGNDKSFYNPKTREKFYIGKKVKIEVVKADKKLRFLDFRMI